MNFCCSATLIPQWSGTNPIEQKWLCVCVCVQSIESLLWSPSRLWLPAACSPCEPWGDAEMPRFRKGNQGQLMSRLDKVKWAMLNGQDPWWARWASVADASRPSECPEMQRGKRTSCSGQVRWHGSVRSEDCTSGPSLLPWGFLGISCCSEVLGGEKRRDRGVRWLWKHVPQTDLVKLQENKP